MENLSMKKEITVSVFGKRGVGKSSTLNTLFELGLDTDPAQACTKDIFSKKINRPEKFQNKVIEVIDLPGIGEGFETDAIYMPLYEKIIPKTDTLLWITQANVRAYKHDQIMFRNISHMIKSNVNFVFGVNKSDILISSHFKLDTVELEDLMRLSDHEIFKEKIDDIMSVFSPGFNKVFPFSSKNICFYSSHFNWNTENLLNKILNQNT